MAFGGKGDWGWIEKGIDDPNYNVEYDEKELNKYYICDCCGAKFTLADAISDFSSRINGISYTSISEAGDLCGNCAADKY